MNWKTGDPERRKFNCDICAIPSEMSTVKENIAAMKVSLSNIEENIRVSGAFKQQVALSFMGIIITIFIQIATFAFLWGGLFNEVKTDTSELLALKRDFNEVQSKGSPITRERLDALEKTIYGRSKMQ